MPSASKRRVLSRDRLFRSRHAGYNKNHMLMIKTSVKPSSLEGLGLFADEKIKKGASVWKFDPRFDIIFDPQEFEKIEPLQKALIDRYAYLSIETKKYIYCIDDARFMNHSSVNNNLNVVLFPGEPETRCVANRDIEIGEELLINYRTFDIADAKSKEPYLDN